MISLLFGVVATGFLLRAIRIRGLDVRSALAAALVAFLIPAVIQSYNPPLLVRFLQSAVCFYLLIPFVLSELSPRIRRPATLAAGLSLAFYVAFVIGGPQRVEPSDAYTGSMRSLGYSAPIGVLGEVFWIDAPTAIEIRLVQDFIAEHTRPDEPIFAAPLHPTYYLLLARPNPTAFLGDFSFADLAMSRERKASEMQRLLASETRYAVVDNKWWSRQADPEKPVLHTLLSAFAPVRFYGSMAILERTSSPERLGMHEIARRIRKRRSEPDDVTALREIIRRWPDEPVPHELLGQLLLAQRKFSAAATSLQTASRLDPANPRLRARLERARNPNAPRSPRRPLATPR
jgi:MFS family permease